MAGATEVYLEVGTTRVFACAVDWPGWCRSGKTEEAALEALAAYEDRYRAVTRRAHVRFPAGAGGDLTVVERVRGSGSTDFGAPGTPPELDDVDLSRPLATRFAKVVEASWALLEATAAAAPAILPKGPRGGGRDTAAIVEHVAEAELAYARTLGVRHRQAGPAFRADLLRALRTATGPWDREANRWPPRYAARRIAWHVLDHVWEIEDKAAAARAADS